MHKLKRVLKSILKKDGYTYKVLKKIYHLLSSIKYRLVNGKQIKKHKSHCNEQIKKAIQKIDQYKNEEYIVFYNPTWLGVAASTIGLFKNIVPLEQVYGKRNVENISQAIINNNIKSVIFSQIVEGWTDILKELKKLNNEISIKVIWHGNCYEFFSDYTWNLNKDVINLYRQGKIDCFGFVRTTMYEFYKRCGFNCYYLQNNVYKNCNWHKNEASKDKIKIGIYNADTRELKNIYTALSATKLLLNSIADVVPINSGAKHFANLLNLQTTSLENYISNEELMQRIQSNSINIYPTFTENSPMFPLESFEMGVPCLIGNNNDYFVGTKLGEYVIIEKEDDAQYIKDKILTVLENTEEVMNLYYEWKKEFNLQCNKLVQEFIKNKC